MKETRYEVKRSLIKAILRIPQERICVHEFVDGAASATSIHKLAPRERCERGKR